MLLINKLFNSYPSHTLPIQGIKHGVLIMNQYDQVKIAAQSGQGFRVQKGVEFRVIDPEGQQVADLWVFSITQNGIDWLSTSQTRDITERMFPCVGQSFYSEQAKPLLTLIENNSPSPHDMLFPGL